MINIKGMKVFKGCRIKAKSARALIRMDLKVRLGDEHRLLNGHHRGGHG